LIKGVEEIEMLRLRRLVIKKVMPGYASVEHVGSTAVKGLGGNGIIDIVIAVPKTNIVSVKKGLERAGYIFVVDAGDHDRLFFWKDYISKGKVWRVHLHLTHRNSRTFTEK
jgi:GrpB-like predicted nucleotidyltransferase (UPF0157 family)